MRDIEKTAIHEAGHAVAYVRLVRPLGFRLRSVSVYMAATSVDDEAIEGGIVDSNGAVLAELPTIAAGTSDEQTVKLCTAAGVMLLAGYAANRAFGMAEKPARWGAEHDWLTCASRYVKPRQLKHYALTYMALPENKRLVRTVADGLLAHGWLDELEVLSAMEYIAEENLVTNPMDLFLF